MLLNSNVSPETGSRITHDVNIECKQRSHVVSVIYFIVISLNIIGYTSTLATEVKRDIQELVSTDR